MISRGISSWSSSLARIRVRHPLSKLSPTTELPYMLTRFSSPVDLYDTQSAAVTEPPVVPDAEDVAADDRIAEEFRREFFDALAQRHRRKRVVNATRPGPKKAATEEILRGPKLGGSRNDRALMREKLLEEQRARKQQQQRAGRR